MSHWAPHILAASWYHVPHVPHIPHVPCHVMGPGFGVEAAWLHLSTLLGVLAVG